jgi:hypothetical protein
MKYKIHLIAILLIMGVSISACTPEDIPESNIVSSQSWIDKPLDGSVLPLGLIEIVSHSANENGITEVETSINGEVIAIHSNPNVSQTLVTVYQDWNPLAPGKYTIMTRAKDPSDLWGEPAQADITILGAETSTPTSTSTYTPTSTNTPQLTRTATVIPTETPTATLPVSDAGFSEITVSTNTISDQGCGDAQVKIQVKAYDPKGVKVVVLFYRLKEKVSGESSEWLSVAMSPVGNDYYEYTISANGLVSSVGKVYSEAFLQYQFVDQNLKDDERLRSEVFGDISYSNCGSAPPPEDVQGCLEKVSDELTLCLVPCPEGADPGTPCTP